MFEHQVSDNSLFYPTLLLLQIGYLHVVIPPDIIGDETSGDMMVTEGTTVKLDCKARGYPTPKIEWRREDNKNIVLRDTQQTKKEGLIIFYILSDNRIDISICLLLVNG